MTPDDTPEYYTVLNVYYNSNHGMPNCTCYAFGRAYEILDEEPNLCHTNAGNWYDYNIQHGYYPYGQTPALGAIACWSKPGGAGHVAVVEVINGDDIITSESAWQGEYFYTRHRSASDPNFSGSSAYIFQGFIYVYMPPEPPSSPLYAGLSTDKSSYALNEAVSFSIHSNGDINSLWLRYPTGRLWRFEDVGLYYQLCFDYPGRYEAFVQTLNAEDTVLSDSVLFYVGIISGDIDCDGVVSANDALLALRMAMSLIPVSNIDAADMDGDGAVSLNDAVIILRRVIGL